MKQEKSNYKLDKKTGHLLEVPSKKQVRRHVRKVREQKCKEPQKAVTVKETEADRNFNRVQKVIDRMHAKAKLPDFLAMARRKFLSTVCVINQPGKKPQSPARQEGTLRDALPPQDGEGFLCRRVSVGEDSEVLRQDQAREAARRHRPRR